MNIEKELSIAFEELDPVTLDKLTEGIDLPADPFSAGQITKRICKKEKTTMKGTIKKKSTALIIALAAAMTMGLSAGAANYYIDHKNTIDSLYGDGAGEVFEKNGYINGQVIEGNHFDISVDSVLSNGRDISIIISAAPTDEFAERLVADPVRLGCELDFDETGLATDILSYYGSASTAYELNGAAVMEYQTTMNEYLESVNIPMMVNISPENKEEELVAEFNVQINKNFDNVIFSSEDGEELELWDFGLSTGKVKLDPDKFEGTYDSYYENDPGMRAFDLFGHIELEYADGSTLILDNRIERDDDEPTDISSVHVESDNDNYGKIHEAHLTFGHLIDSKNVTAVTICGKRFTVQ